MSAGQRLYGFGSRGIATWPPGVPRGTLDADTPIPLYPDRQEVQDAIDAQNAAHGVGNLHVLTYEVQAPSIPVLDDGPEAQRHLDEAQAIAHEHGGIMIARTHDEGESYETVMLRIMRTPDPSRHVMFLDDAVYIVPSFEWDRLELTDLPEEATRGDQD